jgi:hypothetical protein
MSDAERHRARDDRDLADRVGARCEHADERVAGLVVGRAALLGVRQHEPPRGSEHDLLQRVGEIGLAHALVPATRREQRGLVGEVREIGADHSWGGRGDPVEVDIVGQRQRPRVDLEDLAPAVLVGRRDRDAPVEAPRAQERGVEHLGPVRGPQHDDRGAGLEPVHLGEDLVERLLALVVAAEADVAAGPRAPDRVELVDEDDRRL